MNEMRKTEGKVLEAEKEEQTLYFDTSFILLLFSLFLLIPLPALLNDASFSLLCYITHYPALHSTLRTPLLRMYIYGHA